MQFCGRQELSEGAEMRFLVIVEKGPTSYGVYAPDLPGCVAVGETQEEALESMREAMAFHLDGMREDGDAIPEPVSVGQYLEIAV